MSTQLPNQKESHLPDTEILTLFKGKVMLRVSSEPLFTIPDVDVLCSKSISETPTNTNTTLNTSLLLKEPTLDNTCLLVEKPPYQLETSSQSTGSRKVPPFATSSLLLVTKVPTPDAQGPTPLLLATLMMGLELELDFLQAPGKLFQVFAELLSA